MNNRVIPPRYEGNQQYKTGAILRQCHSCFRHKPTAGGTVRGKLRLFKCADCSRKYDERRASAKQPV